MGVISMLVALAAAVAGQPSAENLHAVVAPQQAPVRLELTVTTARPGDRIGLIVVNDTSRTVRYGLATRVQRRHQGRWINAIRAVYGRKHPGFRLIALYAPPHDQGRPEPQGGGVRDEIVLPDDLRRGRYRAIKRVTVVGRATCGCVGRSASAADSTSAFA